MKNSKEIDVAQKLIRCKSVAPNADSALKVVEKECKSIGFKSTKLRFSEKGFDTINNLYAEIGNGNPHFSFAGHVDVVPADKKEWKIDPFAGKIISLEIVFLEQYMREVLRKLRQVMKYL